MTIILTLLIFYQTEKCSNSFPNGQIRNIVVNVYGCGKLRWIEIEANLGCNSVEEKKYIVNPEIIINGKAYVSPKFFLSSNSKIDGNVKWIILENSCNIDLNLRLNCFATNEEPIILDEKNKKYIISKVSDRKNLKPCYSRGVIKGK